MSPYNRDMLDSGIPLKTIIDETKASKIKERHQKLKQKHGQKSIKSRSKSKTDCKPEDSSIEFTNKNFLQAMRQAFHEEVEYSHLYKKVPLKSRSNSKIKKIKEKGREGLANTPTKTLQSSRPREQSN